MPGYAAILFRRSFTDLSLPGAALSRSKSWLAGKADWNEREKTWTFPSEATLTFGYLERESDVYRYQSAEFQYIAFDEGTQFSQLQYTYMFSRLRRTVLVKAPPRMRMGSNPGNIGHAWVKRRLVDDATREPGAAFIPSRVYDNPGLVVEEYRKSLSHLGEVLQQQLLDGDWGAFEGMALARFGEANLIPSFKLEESHTRFEAMDYGLNGTAWALVATDHDGNQIFVDTIACRDLLPDEVCELVVAKRKHAGWGWSNTVWADPSLFHRTYGRTRFGTPTTLDLEFAQAGIPISRANNDARAGLIRLRTLVEPDADRRFPTWHPRAGDLGSPSLFVVQPSCKELIEAIVSAPLQPIDRSDAGEKIDPEWEGRHGHFTAMARYAVMSRPDASKQPDEVEPDDPRAALLWRHRRGAMEKVKGALDRRRYSYS